ncbi:MAG: HU family DNA-binding protein [Treponema sp.]|jgi:predicted histone-like DNA-binding protein|nr:HU family DNA-binding protein [Treponema sp.]
MAVWLRKVRRENPQDRNQSKWYLTQEKSGNVEIKDIAKEIEGWSALSLGDVQSVLSNMMEVLPVFLKLGQSVNLEGFGTFRVSVASDGTATAEELNARHIKGVKLVFQPSVELKRSLEVITFEVPAGAPETPTA